MYGELRPRIVFALVCLLTVTAGCSGQKKQSFQVEGKVLVKGNPAAYAKLRFVPVSEDPKEFMTGANANAEGEFTVQTTKPSNGSAVEYYVAISWRIPKNPNSASDPEYGKEQLPARFQDPKGSTE